MKLLDKSPNNKTTVKTLCRFVLLAITLLSLQAKAVNVLTQHNDLARTGANLQETILTTTNVPTSFGPLFTDNVDGQVYAQPLYVQNVSISNGVHNVVYICTESNSVYAFDADAPGVTYWHVNFGEPFVDSSCGDLTPYIGITSTPVIDPNSGTLYVECKLSSGSSQLHALDLSAGTEKFGGPVPLAATGFTSILEHQRSGLLLLSNIVYLAFASHCDQNSYHGFILGYNATNLTLKYTFNTTPSGSEGGIWSSGMAPAADTNGNIYVMTGNGTFDQSANWSMCILKLSSSLTVEDWTAPVNWSNLNNADQDFGSGGAVLLPSHYLVGIGKDTNLFLADINNLGHIGGNTQTFGAEINNGDVVGKSPVYWQGPAMQYIFLMHANNPTKAFQFTGTSINTTPLGTASFSENDRDGGMSLSANGTNNGILWSIDTDSNLRVYDAVNFPKLLWTGSVGSYVKMNCPTIANGKVYVGTSSTLGVWGLTNYLYIQSGVTNPLLSWATGGKLLQSTNLLGQWTTNSTVSPYSISPTNGHMFYRLSVP